MQSKTPTSTSLNHKKQLEILNELDDAADILLQRFDRGEIDLAQMLTLLSTAIAHLARKI